jgi:hypothetical protein
MRTLRRTSSKVIPVLEWLDTRVVPSSMNLRIEQFLPGLGIQFRQNSLRLVPDPHLIRGTKAQTFAANVQANAPRGLSGTGTGAFVMPLGFGFNPALDHALGREPVVVGLSGPGIGLFTSDLAIQFRQGSAQASPPFNAVPGAGATFGIAFL